MTPGRRSDWERGFAAAYEKFMPQLATAMEKIAALDAEVHRLRAVVKFNDLKEVNRNREKVEEKLRDIRQQYFRSDP